MRRRRQNRRRVGRRRSRRWWGSHRIRRRRALSQHNHHQFLALLTAPLFATNKIKRPRAIKLELRIPILQFHNRILQITLFITLFTHHQHRIQPFRILKHNNIIDLKPVSMRPIIVALRGVENPPILSTGVERISMRNREKTGEEENAETEERRHSQWREKWFKREREGVGGREMKD